MTLKELREKRAKLLKDVEDIRTKYGKDGTPFPKEEFQKCRKMLDEAEECRSKIVELDDVERLDRELKEAQEEQRSTRGRRTDPPAPGREAGDGGGGDESRSEKARKTYAEAFRTWTRNPNRLTEEQRSLLDRGYQTVEGQVLGADGFEQRDMAVGTGVAGGFTVAPLFQAQMSSAMKAFQGVREAGAENYPTSTGASLPFPTDDDTANAATIVTEAGAVGASDANVGQVSIDTYMYSTGIVKVSLQLLQDSAFDIEGWLAGKFAERMGRGTNIHFTTGTGTGQPRGIVTAMGTSGAGIGLTTAANNAITADEIIRLQHAVDPAYRARARYAMSDGVLLIARLLKDSQNRYLFVDAREGAPASLAGKPVSLFTEMTATVTASTNVMLYGDFSHYKTREVLGSVIVARLDQLYMANGQIGFVALGRFGGNFVNPGNFPVKALRTIA